MSAWVLDFATTIIISPLNIDLIMYSFIDILLCFIYLSFIKNLYDTTISMCMIYIIKDLLITLSIYKLNIKTIAITK